MFDIGFLEMVIVAIVALLVLGPDKLPGAVRKAGLYIGHIKRSLAEVRSQVEREIGADELRQTLHNDKIMADLAKKSGASNVKRATEPRAPQQPEQTTTTEPSPPPEAGSVEPGPATPPNDDPNTRT